MPANSRKKILLTVSLIRTTVSFSNRQTTVQSPTPSLERAISFRDGIEWLEKGLVIIFMTSPTQRDCEFATGCWFRTGFYVFSFLTSDANLVYL